MTIQWHICPRSWLRCIVMVSHPTNDRVSGKKKKTSALFHHTSCSDHMTTQSLTESSRGEFVIETEGPTWRHKHSTTRFEVHFEEEFLVLHNVSAELLPVPDRSSHRNGTATTPTLCSGVHQKQVSASTTLSDNQSIPLLDICLMTTHVWG